MRVQGATNSGNTWQWVEGSFWLGYGHNSSGNSILLATTENGCHEVCTKVLNMSTREGNTGLYTPLLVPESPWVDN